MKVGDLKRLNKTDISEHYLILKNYMDNNAGSFTIKESLALTVAREVLHKQLPMKPSVSPNRSLYQCPICHRTLTRYGCIRDSYAYCPKCGQRIDWSGVNSD